MSIPHDVLSPQPRPPEKSNTCLILGLVFGGFGGFVVLCGGCCFGLMFFAFGELEKQTRETLAENKVVREHIGEIKTFDIDWMGSLQMSSAGRADTFVFHATGDKGNGTVVAVVLQAGDEFYIESGTLTMDNGEAFELLEGTEVTEDAEDAPEMPPESPGPVQSTSEDDKFAAKVQAALSGNSVFSERIGDVRSFTYDIVQSTDERGENVFVFHVTGSKGSGKLRAECITDDNDTERVTSAELILDNGDSVQLFPDKPLE
jgi:hypothetical protein